MSENQTVYTRFRDIALAQADKVAILESGRKLTFKNLLDLVDCIADSFPEHVQSVGIVMSHRAEMVAAMLAVLKCGGRYVPAEPSFPPGRIRFMMEEAGVDFVLTDREFQSRLSSLPTKVIDCIICGKKPRIPSQPDRSSSASPAYVLYTSGTTGKPKGVCVTNGNICHYASAFANEFSPTNNDIVLQYSVCSFDIFVEEVYASLLNGAALAIPNADEKKDIQTLMDFIDEQKVTIVSGFPYLFAEMNHLDSLPQSLRLVLSGGDILRASYVNRLVNQVEVYNTYGPSETTVCATYYRCNRGQILEDETYPIGHAIRGVEVLILDEQGHEVPHGKTGEICILGDGVSLGYIGNRDEENKAFVKRADGSRMYRSGDLGYKLPDGNIAFLYRIDNQVMIEGKRVEVKEVESRLYQCRNVQQAFVKACLDEHENPYLIAYLVPANDRLKISEVKDELAINLPDFMIPEYFVFMNAIPLNANGKPDETKLPRVAKTVAK